MAGREGRRTEQRRERRDPRLWRGRAGEAQRPDPGGAGSRRLGVQEVARAPALERLLSLGSDAFFAVRLRRVLEIRLDLAVELERHRLAKAIAAAPGGDSNPAFRNRIFDDAWLFLAVELDPDAARKQRLVEIFAARVEGEPVGWGVGWSLGHARALALRPSDRQRKAYVKHTCLCQLPRPRVRTKRCAKS